MNGNGMQARNIPDWARLVIQLLGLAVTAAAAGTLVLYRLSVVEASSQRTASEISGINQTIGVHRDRLTTLERGDLDLRGRLQRIEDKLDRLIERERAK